MSNIENGFDTATYVTRQTDFIKKRFTEHGSDQVFMEFGGKPFGDHHAARVLPGYDPDCKAEILSQLLPYGKIAMVVNARDILLPKYGRTLGGRIRGDSGLKYDQETVRLIHQARSLSFDVKDVVVAVAPKNPIDRDRRALDEFRETLFADGVTMHTHYEIPGYPTVDIIDYADELFGDNDLVAQVGNHLIAFSPGGGSGKFGVLLSEIYHALRNNQNPHFLKFETFPIFTADVHHALNLAFEAATADLGNRVVALPRTDLTPKTTYDKDVENFILLKRLFARYGTARDNAVLTMNDPTDMSVNRIMDGITDENKIIEACRNEILKRLHRYVTEVRQGAEKITTLERTLEIYEVFVEKYGPQIRSNNDRPFDPPRLYQSR